MYIFKFFKQHNNELRNNNNITYGGYKIITSKNELETFLNDKNLILASNRGPIEFFYEENGEIGMKRGAGGMVPTMLPIIEKANGNWIASALNDADREIAIKFRGNKIPVPLNDPKFNLPLLILDEKKYDEFYNKFSNPLLWFIQHYLWNLSLTPEIDQQIHDAWNSYQYVNKKFAQKIIEEVESNKKEPLIMLQDYHLYTCPLYIRQELNDIFLSQFIHIPWPQPDYLGILPDYMEKAIIEGLLSNSHIGFHIHRYIYNFLLICEKYADEVDYKNKKVYYDGREIVLNNYPISVDVKKLKQNAGTDEVLKQEEYVKNVKGDKFLIYRTERTDLSKNIVRGFKAYDFFLEKYPQFHEKVVFFITGVSTREIIKEYRDYKEMVNSIINDINEKYSINKWKPIVPYFDAPYSLVTAAFKHYDCLLINSIHDGMNIVPKEGSIVNENNGILIISETTGSYDELKDYSININALDISQTADALYKAITMDKDERKECLEGLKRCIRQYDVYKWIGEQFNDIQKIF